MLVQADANNRIRAVVTYQVDGNTRQESAEKTTDYPVLAARIGATSELEFDPAAVSRTISEGDKGQERWRSSDGHGQPRHHQIHPGLARMRTNSRLTTKTGQISTVVGTELRGGGSSNCERLLANCTGASGTPNRECASHRHGQRLNRRRHQYNTRKFERGRDHHDHECG